MKSYRKYGMLTGGMYTLGETFPSTAEKEISQEMPKKKNNNNFVSRFEQK